MSEESQMIEMMHDQQKSVEDTCTNLEGLIRKLAGVNQELGAAGYEKFTQLLAGPFAMLSEIHTELHQIGHMMELEYNRLVNESSEPVTAAAENTEASEAE